ncbi:hypothetical protein [Acetivibrio cellulolyticus]|uniref:hypothetical protein n=1 Tax=Acetivibrio cellulolyticus TaxID=35830 RepID=UPI0001E2EC2D|nr:hypothetical protein [Acetivibrio cellulolyticus]
MQKSNFIWGFLLIILGGLLLSSNIFNFNFLTPMLFLPILVLGIGLSFEASYFINRRAPGLLVPGGILSTIGLLFFFEVTTNWQFASRTWPIYVLSVAIGLFQLYLFSGKPKGLLIPIFILLAVTVSFLSMTILSVFNSLINFRLVISILLILFGLFIVTKKSTGQKEWN